MSEHIVAHIQLRSPQLLYVTVLRFAHRLYAFNHSTADALQPWGKAQQNCCGLLSVQNGFKAFRLL